VHYDVGTAPEGLFAIGPEAGNDEYLCQEVPRPNEFANLPGVAHDVTVYQHEVGRTAFDVLQEGSGLLLHVELNVKRCGSGRNVALEVVPDQSES
jgi:hypothetical protein